MAKRETARARLGRRAEGLVCRRLEARGYTIVGRNVRVGRREIDLIARRGRTLAFVEVRSRRHGGFVSPLETIGPAKIANVRAAAREWVRARGLRGFALRFDAAAVTFEQPRGTVDYRENAF